MSDKSGTYHWLRGGFAFGKADSVISNKEKNSSIKEKNSAINTRMTRDNINRIGIEELKQQKMLKDITKDVWDD